MSSTAMLDSKVPAQCQQNEIEYYPVCELLDNAVAKFPNNTAITFNEESVSYRDLQVRVNAIAYSLQSMGIGKDIKVGLFMPNHLAYVAMYYAILKTGATVVNYNPLYAEQELVHQIADSETSYMVTLPVEPLVGKLDSLFARTDLKKILTYGEASFAAKAPLQDISALADSNAGNAPEPVTIDIDQDIAVLQYTGGTTGVPKGAVLTHKNLSANVEQFAHWLDFIIEPGKESQLGVLPLFHVFAMTVVMNLSFRFGMEILLFSKFDPKQLAPIMAEKEPSIIAAVPAMYNAFATHTATKDQDMSYTKFCISGGAPIPADVKNLFETRSGAKISEAYGLTEASPVVTSNPPQGLLKPGSIGPAIYDTTVDIVSLEDGVTVLGPHEKGELCVAGPQVMSGYYNKPKATDDVIKNGRLHTGDIAYKDEDGYVFIVDRLKDMVLISGYNVYPTQIEGKIYQHPAVEECIAVGVPDQKRGESIWAWIKVAEGQELSDKDLRAFLKNKLSPIEMPRKFVIDKKELPKTAVGKLSKKLLLEQENITK